MVEHPIAPDDWRTIVANVPLVSVDLVVEHDGGVLLGLRENEPAKGEWFVPGGTVMKGERLTEAAHRVADQELGTPVTLEERLGTFEHLYDTSDVEGVDSKHYLATAFRCRFAAEDPEVVGDAQHSRLELVEPPYEGLHPYVERYIEML